VVSIQKGADDLLKLPLRGPSYMAVVLNVADTVDGFPFTLHFLFAFSPVQSNPYIYIIRRPSPAR